MMLRVTRTKIMHACGPYATLCFDVSIQILLNLTWIVNVAMDPANLRRICTESSEHISYQFPLTRQFGKWASFISLIEKIPTNLIISRIGIFVTSHLFTTLLDLRYSNFALLIACLFWL